MRASSNKSRFSLTLMAAGWLLAFAPAAVRADQWLVSPERDTSQQAVTLTFAKGGLTSSLSRVLQALSGSTVWKNSYRLIDLTTGGVRALSAAELSTIVWMDQGRLVDAAGMASQAGHIVLVVSDYNGMSASIVVLDGTRVTQAIVLSADQRMLVGEPACDKGFAPESSTDGTRCVDIDECDAMLHDCAADATCTNIDGSFECECDPGFDGDGKMCIPPGSGEPVGSDGGGMVMANDGGVRAPPDPTSHEGEMAGGGDGCSCSVIGGGNANDAREQGGLLASGLLLCVVWLRSRKRRR